MTTSIHEPEKAGPLRLRVRVLQHVPFEGPAAIADWATARGHELSITHVYEATPPPLDSFDFLAIMGGPMNVYEDLEHPWLTAEKVFISSAIAAGKATLGVCLGAQLLSVVLGGRVTKGLRREIGWFPVTLTDAGRDSTLLAGFPSQFKALHWHGDTFSIPEGAQHLASSSACGNQAFAYDAGRVVGLQFHLEETRSSLQLLSEHGADELIEDTWVQSPEDLLAPDAPFDSCKQLLFTLLDRMTTEGRP